MDRPCTHRSLDREQGWLGGLVVQTPGVKMRRPCASQTRTVRTLRTSQTYVDYEAGADGG